LFFLTVAFLFVFAEFRFLLGDNQLESALNGLWLVQDKFAWFPCTPLLNVGAQEALRLGSQFSLLVRKRCDADRENLVDFLLVSMREALCASLSVQNDENLQLNFSIQSGGDAHAGVNSVLKEVLAEILVPSIDRTDEFLFVVPVVQLSHERAHDFLLEFLSFFPLEGTPKRLNGVYGCLLDRLVLLIEHDAVYGFDDVPNALRADTSIRHLDLGEYLL